MILQEFECCLRPGGSLILTVDVSVTAALEIPLPRARELIETLESRFESRVPFDRRSLLADGALTAAGDVCGPPDSAPTRSQLLPWRWISRATPQDWRGGRWGRPFFDLAVVGMVLRKR